MQTAKSAAAPLSMDIKSQVRPLEKNIEIACWVFACATQKSHEEKWKPARWNVAGDAGMCANGWFGEIAEIRNLARHIQEAS